MNAEHFWKACTSRILNKDSVSTGLVIKGLIMISAKTIILNSNHTSIESYGVEDIDVVLGCI